MLIQAENITAAIENKVCDCYNNTRLVLAMNQKNSGFCTGIIHTMFKTAGWPVYKLKGYHGTSVLLINIQDKITMPAPGNMFHSFHMPDALKFLILVLQNRG